MYPIKYSYRKALSLMDLPDEILLIVYSDFRGSDFYGSVLVNKRMNVLLTSYMYRELRLFLPCIDANGSGSVKDTTADYDEHMTNGLIKFFELASMADKQYDAAIRPKGSGALLKRTLKEQPSLSTLIHMITIIGPVDAEDPTPTDGVIRESPDEDIREDTYYAEDGFRGVKNLLRHLTSLKCVSFECDSALLGLVVDSLPSSITSLSIANFARLKFGDIYKFKKLRRLAISGTTDWLILQASLSKSIQWETLYALRMLLEQNSNSLQELVLDNLPFDMLFKSYVPIFPHLTLLAVVLSNNIGLLSWAWLTDIISSVGINFRIIVAFSRQGDMENMRIITQSIDWKTLKMKSRRCRIKRKSLLRGHKIAPVTSWISVHFGIWSSLRGVYY
ncbi:uncharacterized protein V1510DRAFT_409621 [Dipodascopsis tothii]|uniref:uncharacterized protein n=1 Tax=Dipodascopsis tothii TaxID=44089 RepID=UPI0034CDD3F5